MAPLTREELEDRLDITIMDYAAQILDQISLEIERQLELWGTDFDKKNTANDWAAYICRYVAEGAYDGRKGQYTPERFREHLLKAAALCISAAMNIDRHGNCAPRHYDREKRDSNGKKED